MKHQVLYSLKKKNIEKILCMSSAVVAIGAFRVKCQRRLGLLFHMIPIVLMSRVGNAFDIFCITFKELWDFVTNKITLNVGGLRY